MDPYLSVVIAAREETESEQRQIQLFIDAWIEQAKGHGLQSEIIIAGTTAAPALNLPTDLGPCKVRYIAAPREASLAKTKNAAIRQARGQFILATNPGILFSDELMQFLGSRRLDAACLYRTDRYDVDGLPHGIGAGQRPSYCREHSVRLHAREGTFELTPDGFRGTAPVDITPADSGIYFSAGWFPPEKYRSTGETFRWMHNDAEILARVPEGGGTLRLEVEPGPGVAALPQLLELIDKDAHAVASWDIAGRTTIAVAIPATAQVMYFRLRITGGGRPILNDDRILNLAVFRCDWAEHNPALTEGPSFIQALQRHKSMLGRLLETIQRTGSLLTMTRAPLAVTRAARLLGRRGRDIFEGGLDFQLGPGWFYLEESGGERFRWLSREARFFLRMPPSTSRLALLIEPGPNQGDRLEFIARLENNDGAILLRHRLTGLTYLEFTVPAAPGSIAALHFSSEGTLEKSRGDERPLSFRVHACGAGSRDVSRPTGLKSWPLLALEPMPPAVDWITVLDPQNRDLDEMGHADHLHTNAASDFLLMSRSRWLDVRGFPEIGMTTDRIDALLCYAAHQCGAREEILCDPMRVYHIADSPPEEMNFSMPPAVQQEDLMWLIAQMRRLHAPAIFNREDWGC
jgi:hypothetical protein